jgi:uncharacterized protein YciI
VHYILFYTYVPDIAERRGPYRDAHLGRIAAERGAGHIVLAGALGDPPHSAAIVFKDVEPGHIERFAADDPYVEAGLVRESRIEPWNLV